ncbi:PAS domain-containing protein [Lacibacterium aquatile]|uniref:PAS domain-containing protein n=1 Tax=Lacibacterium aquatile TaxID=1168082 RepID=A0ABW5DLG3_9PROT
MAPMWTGDFPPLDGALENSGHPRIVTLEFLDVCSPRIRRFYSYWESRRNGRLMPTRGDINPADIADLLPYIVLTEVLNEAPYLIYRLVGTKQVAMRGRDPTGMPVISNHLGHHIAFAPDEIILNYRFAIEKRQPIYDYYPLTGPDTGDTSFEAGPVKEIGTLLLPLSADGERVNMVICCTDIRNA